MLITKIISKNEWIIITALSIAYAAAYINYSDTERGFFFVWSAAFTGFVLGLVLFYVAKKIVSRFKSQSK